MLCRQTNIPKPRWSLLPPTEPCKIIITSRTALHSPASEGVNLSSDCLLSAFSIYFTYGTERCSCEINVCVSSVPVGFAAAPKHLHPPFSIPILLLRNEWIWCFSKQIKIICNNLLTLKGHYPDWNWSETTLWLGQWYDVALRDILEYEYLWMNSWFCCHHLFK